ncbi:dodecin [Sphingomonas sp. 1P06PA]|uniref:dodecin n=1 Tax=Sphingomonas sp. 1P06PA TaxID=554121 RepID=UPI0039A5AD1A
MSEHSYRVIELVGSSPDSIDEAIRTAIRRASATLHNLRWFEVVETRGHVEDGEIKHFQVTLRMGFTLDAPA